jgi:hypothetical protein
MLRLTRFQKCNRSAKEEEDEAESGLAEQKKYEYRTRKDEELYTCTSS